MRKKIANDPADKLSYKILILLLVFVDRAIKLFLIRLNIPISYNQGISFGLLPSSIWLVVNIMVVVIITWYTAKKPSPGTALLLAGGISNLIDRIISKGVIDYIKLPYFPWRFNLADGLITAGFFLVLINLPKNKLVIL